MRKYLFSIIILISFLSHSDAQTGLMGYGSNALIPAQAANPAMVGENRFHVSIPALSSIQMRMNNSFKLVDWMSTSSGKTRIDFNQFNKVVQDDNYMSGSGSMDLGNIGFRLKERGYLSGGIQASGLVKGNFSKDLVKLLAEGNYQNSNLQLNKESIYALSYASFYVGYAHKMLDGRFKWGVNAKYIMGLGHAATDNANFSIKTDPNSSPAYALELSGQLSARAAGLFNPNFFSNRKGLAFGKGFGLDAGGTMKLNDKVQLALSATNLGIISWSQQNAANVATKGTGSVSFKGETVQLGAKTSANRSALDSTVNQVRDLFTTKYTAESYRTILPATIYGSVLYQLNPQNAALLVVSGQAVNGDFLPMTGLKYQYTPNRWLQLMSGVSWYGGSGVGFGAGVVVSPGPFQLHILADNVLGFQLDNTRFTQIQVGLNIVLKRPAEDIEDEEPTQSTGRVFR
jgi:Family of unknown function (DUF5723)